MKHQHSAPAPTFNHDPYPRYKAGEYLAIVLDAKISRVKVFQGWKCVLRLRLVDTDGEVYAFLNMGRGADPVAGRNSKYFRTWTMANGSQPKKRQQLSERVFRGAMFRLRIRDAARTHDGKKRTEGEVYSVVDEFLECVGSPGWEKHLTMKAAEQPTKVGMAEGAQDQQLAEDACNELAPEPGCGKQITYES